MKSQFKNIFVNFGGSYILRKINRTPRVLFWHGVDDNPDSLVEAESINKNNFIKQIDYLNKNFEIISIQEFYFRLKNNAFKGTEIVLTFDDGYKNNLKVLAPILKKRNLPFTVFITTNNITNGTIFPTSIVRLIVFGSHLNELNLPSINKKYSLNSLSDKKNTACELSKILKTSELSVVKFICEDILGNINQSHLNYLMTKYHSIKPLTWEEVKDLSSYGCTIGSHCLDHICCHTNQIDIEVKNQILQSKLLIESVLNQPCDYFAFPNGDFTDFAIKCVENSGYKLGFSTRKERINTSMIQFPCVPRISVPYDFNTFQILVNYYPKKM